MKEEDILSHYNGKLYRKEKIEQWDLPPSIKDQIQLDEFDFFFLATSKKENHGQPHVHFTIYPSEYNLVFLLEVETGQILPQLLHKVLEVLKRDKLEIITSTGYCSHENLCHFGVFCSTPNKIDKKELLERIGKLEKVKNTNLYKFTCQGCEEA